MVFREKPFHFGLQSTCIKHMLRPLKTRGFGLMNQMNPPLLNLVNLNENNKRKCWWMRTACSTAQMCSIHTANNSVEDSTPLNYQRNFVINYVTIRVGMYFHFRIEAPAALLLCQNPFYRFQPDKTFAALIAFHRQNFSWIKILSIVCDMILVHRCTCNHIVITYRTKKKETKWKKVWTMAAAIVILCSIRAKATCKSSNSTHVRWHCNGNSFLCAAVGFLKSSSFPTKWYKFILTV